MSAPANTRFAAWLEDSALTPVSLARALDVSTQAVYQWRSGATTPGLANAVRLEILSEGAVPCSSW